MEKNAYTNINYGRKKTRRTFDCNLFSVYRDYGIRNCFSEQNMKDTNKYKRYQEELEKWYESLCIQCGVCCGVHDGDPCMHLLKTVNGKYICATYATRLGPQKTVSGKTFNCVPIKEVLQHKGYLSECAYRDGSITGCHQIKK